MLEKVKRKQVVNVTYFEEVNTTWDFDILEIPTQRLMPLCTYPKRAANQNEKVPTE